MKKSTKALLLSALVMPGAGHFYLKRYIPGSALAGVTVIALYYLMSKVVEHALQIVEMIQSSGRQPDVSEIAGMVTDHAIGAEAHQLNAVTLTIIACWIIGMIDSYRLGKALDKKRSD